MARTLSWALFALLAARPAMAEAPPAALPPDELARLTTVGADLRDVAIAPTGDLVAWTEVSVDPDGSSSGKTVVRVADLRTRGPAAHPGRPAAPARTGSSVGSRRPAPATSAAGASGPAWAPDGRRLAFLAPPSGSLAGRAGGWSQIWVSNPDFSGARELTHLGGSIDSLLWSPDGRRIAFLYEGPRPGGVGMAAEAGGVEADRRLAVVDAGTGDVQLVSAPGLFVFELDWAPDGGSFVVLATAEGGDAGWWTAELYLVPCAVIAPAPGGRSASPAARPPAAVPLWKPPFQVASPRFSPDGRAIAFIGGLMSDQGTNGGDLYLLPLAGGEPTDLTPGLAASAAWFSWTSPGEIVFAETVDGSCAVGRLDLRSGAVATLWSASRLGSGPQLVSTGGSAVGLSLARDGRTAAAVLQGFRNPPEIWAGPLATLGEARPLTARHAGLQPAWGEARSLHWQGDAGRVQGWLLAPPSALLAASAGKLHPLVVLVHGGPAGAVKAAWPTVSGALANHGFFVLMPNPRGSFGAGEAFTRANFRDFGYGDWRDVLAGLDAALAEAPVDRARVGIYGWSYGGYLAMWAVTQTDRFRAAVAGAGIANWQSYFGETGYPFVPQYFGATPYADPRAYARSSPLSFITRARTPTLILHGDRDRDVPPAQALEFWQALKTLGVETRLVLFPGEGHHLGPIANRDHLGHLLAWFDTYLK